MIIIFIAIIALILLSAFFSSCEIAYSSVSKVKLKMQSDDGNQKANRAIKIVDDYSTTLSTVLVGNNLVNTLISSLGTVAAMSLIGEEYGSIVSTAVLTVIILIFGEIIPKTIGNKFSFSMSLFYVDIYNFFRILFFPITFVVNAFIFKVFKGLDEVNEETQATDEELITIASQLEEDGYIDKDDAELIKSAIDFTTITAREIMIPRVDVFAIDINDSKMNILNNEELYRFSRVPVYEDSIDNIIGVINTTTLMKQILANQSIDLKSLIKPAFYVHKTKNISTILTEFKENNEQIAIIIDDFGGVMGILTMEDIIEELVGDVFDETDEIVYDYEQLSDNTYLVDGDMNINDFFELFAFDDENFEAEYTTVGGFCTDALQKIPEVNDTFEFNNLIISIIECDKMRVGKVKVEIKSETIALEA